MAKTKEMGTKKNPWQLKTAPGTSDYTMYKEDDNLVCKVGGTTLHYQWRCVHDLHAMLKKNGDWIEPGGTDEQKLAKEGTIEAWARSLKNPVGGWHGLKKDFVVALGRIYRL